jgi:hypothetical protein
MATTTRSQLWVRDEVLHLPSLSGTGFVRVSTPW